MKSRPFRLTALKPRESDLQRQIMDYLAVEQARKRVIWYCRVNGGAVKKGLRWIKFYVLYLLGKRPISKGKSDIEGMLPGGKYFALEVKQPGEKAMPEQLDFLEAVRDGGGIAAVVFSFNDVKSVLFGELDWKR